MIGNLSRLSCKGNYNNMIIQYQKYEDINFGNMMNTYIFNKINYKMLDNPENHHYVFIGSILQKV